jgi:hypothetical protein
MAYTGDTKYREDTGVDFGVATDPENRQPSTAEFSLVVFEVRT